MSTLVLNGGTKKKSHHWDLKYIQILCISQYNWFPLVHYTSWDSFLLHHERVHLLPVVYDYNWTLMVKTPTHTPKFLLRCATSYREFQSLPWKRKKRARKTQSTEILGQCGDFEVSEATCGIMVNSNINTRMHFLGENRCRAAVCRCGRLAQFTKNKKIALQGEVPVHLRSGDM